ncbi:hypothetical protein [Azonexus sp.]|jgi:hypothetical protein|uniref:hypothetical protein n=1 Tax=Azonexus sp. TaxID=1872668 RepID=UPI00282E544D|nr:hypothetical protein [Azonexus sp.]MDR1995006.1 hypothetical protein [Azonexus sp.]
MTPRWLIGTLLLGFAIYLPFAGVLIVGYHNSAPIFLGVIFWVELIVFGFPWNIPVAFLSQSFIPVSIFKSLNQNHDTTVGWLMFVAYISVFINSMILAAIIRWKNRE